MASLNQNCKIPIGETNKFYVPHHVLSGYNILNFDNGNELIDIGYNNVIHKKYIILYNGITIFFMVYDDW